MNTICKPKKTVCNRTSAQPALDTWRCPTFTIPQPDTNDELETMRNCFERQKFGMTGDFNQTCEKSLTSVSSMASTVKSGKNNEDYLKDTQPRSKIMSLQVRHGADVHHMNVESKNSCNIKVSDVMRHIEKELKIPIRKQNLFFRGMDIKKYSSADLELLGIHQNCMIRCVGQSDNENFLENFIRY